MNIKLLCIMFAAATSCTTKSMLRLPTLARVYCAAIPRTINPQSIRMFSGNFRPELDDLRFTSHQQARKIDALQAQILEIKREARQEKDEALRKAEEMIESKTKHLLGVVHNLIHTMEAADVFAKARVQPTKSPASPRDPDGDTYPNDWNQNAPDYCWVKRTTPKD